MSPPDEALRDDTRFLEMINSITAEGKKLQKRVAESRPDSLTVGVLATSCLAIFPFFSLLDSALSRRSPGGDQAASPSNSYRGRRERIIRVPPLLHRVQRERHGVRLHIQEPLQLVRRAFV
jgi:hypothetical protein